MCAVLEVEISLLRAFGIQIFLCSNHFLPEALTCLINNNILLNSMINPRDHYAQVDYKSILNPFGPI